MSGQKKPYENGKTDRSIHTRTIRIDPGSWSGRLVIGLVLATLLFLVLFFFSIFLAIGAVIIGLAALLGIFNYVTGRTKAEGIRTERDGTNVIDAERSPEDGVYRPRNYSDPRDRE